ncbi:MAG: hypothetical protein WDN09_02095 [bacterium]
MRHCKDCEPAQEIHWMAYLSVVISWINDPYNDFMDIFFKRAVDRLSKKWTMPFFRGMIWLHLARWTDEPNQKDSLRTKVFWNEAIRRGITMREFHLGPIDNVFMAEYKGKTITFDGLPRPDSGNSDSMKWMDNKGIMKEKFLKEGLPVADGGRAWSGRGAKKIFSRVRKPVIAKPNLGSRSRHTTIHIETEDGVVKAFRKANKLSPIVIIEEELEGSLFRGTLVGNKLAGVVRRDPPQVTGDGASTVRQLWEKENTRPERAHGPIFHTIPFDKEAEIELARQKLTMESIPASGRIVTFSQKTSRGVGGSTTEVTDIVHPENRAMLEHLGAYLDDPLVGVDFIMKDIAVSWKDQPRSGIIECNSLPFIDLHEYVLFGRPNNVAAILWDYVMPESRTN